MLSKEQRAGSPKSQNADKLREVVTEPQGPWVCPPPPGFKSLPSEQDVPLIRIPNPDEVQSTLTGAMNIVMYRNKVMSDIKYEYETQFLEPLYPEMPDHRPKITEL